MSFEAKALFDYAASEFDELSLSTGDVLAVLSTDEDPWWMCKNTEGIKGLAPNNYLQRTTAG